MKFKKIGITLLFLLTIPSVFSQIGWLEGEIFLTDGESKVGLVKITLVSKDLIAIGGDQAVRYKPARKGKKKKYRQAEIDHLIVTDTQGGYQGYYEYVKVSEDKKQLFRVVSTGTAILYHRHVNMSSSTGGGNGVMMTSSYEVDEYYAKRETEDIASPLVTGRISKSFRKRAIAYYANCPSLIAQLENKTYRKRDVEKVATAYNQCELAN